MTPEPVLQAVRRDAEKKRFGRASLLVGIVPFPDPEESFLRQIVREVNALRQGIQIAVNGSVVGLEPFVPSGFKLG